jgi:hypothetical protein
MSSQATCVPSDSGSDKVVGRYVPSDSGSSEVIGSLRSLGWSMYCSLSSVIYLVDLAK